LLATDIRLHWNGGLQADLDAMILGDPNHPETMWVLQEPVSISRTRESGSESWRLSAFRMQQDARKLEFALDLEEDGLNHAVLTIEDTDLAKHLQPWVETLLPDVTAKRLQLVADRKGETLEIRAISDIRLNRWDQQIEASGAIDWDSQGLRFDQVSLTAGQQQWLSLNGTLPYRLVFVQGRLMPDMSDDQDIKLSIATSHSEEWISWIQPYLPVALASIELQAEASGTLHEPKIDLQSVITTQASVDDDFGIPATRLQSEISMIGNHMNLRSIRADIGPETFEMTGNLIFPDQILDWFQWKKTPVPWTEIRYDLHVPQSDLSPLAALVPAYLRPVGSMQFDLEGVLKNGASGHLSFEGLSTRPVFSFGALRNISGNVHFQGRQIELNPISAEVGHELLLGSGLVKFPDAGEPVFSFRIQGDDIPIVRKAGVVLRADLQVEAHQEKNVPVTLSGQIRLKDGVLLADVTELFNRSAGGRGVKSRPPYFSVTTAPFHDWKLAMAISGDRFMKLQTPVMDGVLSIDMSLEGTLGEPFMHGRVWFNEGTVKFPFARFAIDNGVVQLNRDDPYVPVVNLHGESSRLDYQLQLRVTGSADDPEVAFTSSPALSSDQILLMIIAGEDPSGTVDYSGTRKASSIGTYLSTGIFSSANGDTSTLLNRLNLEWGNKLSRRGRETMDLEFELNDSFQLLGEYDEYDNWNGGIRWRILNPNSVRKIRAAKPEGGDGEE